MLSDLLNHAGTSPTQPRAGLIMTADELAWQNNAACADADPEAFFPEMGSTNRDAVSMCNICPVRQHCLEHAFMYDEPFGIWGGLSERERRRLRRRM